MPVCTKYVQKGLCVCIARRNCIDIWYIYFFGCFCILCFLRMACTYRTVCLYVSREPSPSQDSIQTQTKGPPEWGWWLSWAAGEGLWASGFQSAPPNCALRLRSRQRCRRHSSWPCHTGTAPPDVLHCRRISWMRTSHLLYSSSLPSTALLEGGAVFLGTAAGTIADRFWSNGHGWLHTSSGHTPVARLSSPTRSGTFGESHWHAWEGVARQPLHSLPKPPPALRPSFLHVAGQLVLPAQAVGERSRSDTLGCHAWTCVCWGEYSWTKACDSTRRRISRKQRRQFDKCNVREDCKDEQCKEYRNKMPYTHVKKHQDTGGVAVSQQAESSKSWMQEG